MFESKTSRIWVKELKKNGGKKKKKDDWEKLNDDNKNIVLKIHL